MTIERAAARLRREELAPLVAEMARRFGDGEPTTVSLAVLDERGLGVMADLLGIPHLPSTSRRMPVQSLIAALELGNVAELKTAVESLTGPITNRRAARNIALAERTALWSWFTDAAAQVEGDRLAGWAARVRAAGVRGGVEAHRRRLEHALEVLRRLPADGTTLASLADDALGDPHGLDPGRSIATLVLDALADTVNLRLPKDAEGIRALWETAGVAPDALSSNALVLGLEVPEGHPLAGYLQLARSVSEPVILTLAQLRRWPIPPLAARDAAYVVENPSVVAEAARRGWHKESVLVCSSGRPTVAVVTLLRQLGAGGAALHQHADFDPAGLAITEWLRQRAGTRPWRMDAVSYEAALAHDRNRVAITAEVPATPWDPALHDAMRVRAVAVYEEQVRADLLGSV